MQIWSPKRIPPCKSWHNLPWGLIMQLVFEQAPILVLILAFLHTCFVLLLIVPLLKAGMVARNSDGDHRSTTIISHASHSSPLSWTERNGHDLCSTPSTKHWKCHTNITRIHKIRTFNGHDPVRHLAT